TTSDTFIKLTNLIEKEGERIWLESSPWRRPVISGLWHTLMLVKQQQLNGSCTIQVGFTKQVKAEKEHVKRTGWNKSKSVGLQSLQRQQLPSGKTIELTLSIPQVTLISLLKLSVLYVY